MENISYTVKINPAPEGGYWAEVPALPGCFTQGETVEEITVMVQEAIELYLTGLLRRGERFPVEKRVKRTFAFPVSIRAPRIA
jgi:predicted RNase H-like HicB family nuclease